MGKRKSEDSEYLKKKIRRLEKKLRRLPGNSEEDEEEPRSPRPRSQQPPSPPPIQLDDIEVEASPVPNNGIEDNLIPADNELPEEFLLALGNEGEDKDEVGEPIRHELSIRWSKIMMDGLGKEAKEKIIAKYPTPSNFPQAVAPQMNPEISGILSETSIKRDKRIIYRQNLTGKLLNSLGGALTNILKGNINSKLLIEQINDAAKMATELHHQDSCSRKFFALAGANKIVQDAVKTSRIDKYLFGSDCADKIKAAQSIQRTSTQIAENIKKTKQSSNINKKQLNWKGPSQYRPQQQSARDGPHHQQPTYKKQPHFERPRQKERRPPQNRSKLSRRHR